jgi:tagatose 1,6-diphosphate aldolase
MNGFQFFEPGQMRDGDLELSLSAKVAGDPAGSRVPAYVFKMVHASHRAKMGRIELRIGNTHHITQYAGHVGYRVYPEFRGNHYAARGCRLLLPLARRHGFKTLWITCNPDNIASRRTCELIGAEMVEIVKLPSHTSMFRRGEREKCRYRLDL